MTANTDGAHGGPVLACRRLGNVAKKRSVNLGGRPPLPKGEARSVPLMVRLKPADMEALQAWAKGQDTTPAGIVRDLIERALARREKG